MPYVFGLTIFAVIFSIGEAKDPDKKLAQIPFLTKGDVGNRIQIKGDSVKIQKLQSWARWVIGGRDLTQHALNNAVELKRLEPQVSPPTESSY